MPSETTYKYGKRETADMSRRSFALGQGRISGYLSLTLGLLSFLAVLAWRFPAQLTTRELREVYDPEQLRLVLMTCMHHSSDKPAIDTNYAVHLPMIDRLFGTYHVPDRYWPLKYGTTKPLPRSFLGQAMHPFRAEE